MRILISGGHLTPALAFIEYVKKVNPEAKIFFAGRKYSRKNDKQLSWEKSEVGKYNATFIPFSSGKIGQGNIIDKIANFFLLIKAILHSLIIIPKYRPTIFVSFGGYLGVPLAISSWLWRVPIITHEQTRASGIANSIISSFASVVAVAYEETAEQFPANKTVVTGNPIRDTVLENNNNTPEWFTTSSKKPILYVTGGSQGSEVLNTTVSRSLKKILSDWIVIHQCGQATHNRNYQEELLSASSKLSKRKQSRYFVRSWVSAKELAWIYSHGTAMISRAGANTTAEIIVRQMPAILVPLPFSHKDEQMRNAKAIADTGGAELIQQKDLTPKTLQDTLEVMQKKPGSYRRKLQKISHQHTLAAEKLYNLIEPYHAQ